jgi:hypothetical protein
MREIFVYYKLSVVDEAAARDLVLNAQHGLMRKYPGLAARLLKRPEAIAASTRAEATAATLTFMETYSMSDDAGSAGVDSHVERDIEAALLPLHRLLQGPRHVEAFVACA